MKTPRTREEQIADVDAALDALYRPAPLWPWLAALALLAALGGR